MSYSDFDDKAIKFFNQTLFPPTDQGWIPLQLSDESTASLANLIFSLFLQEEFEYRIRSLSIRMLTTISLLLLELQEHR